MNSTPSSPPSPVSSQPSRKRQRSSSMVSDTSSSSIKRSLSDGPSQDCDPLSTLSLSDLTLLPSSNARYGSVPPAEKVVRVESAKAESMKAGQTWYLVDRSWWKRWRKACTGVVDKEGAVTEEELGPVDNTAIVDMNGNLRAPLSDGIDFELVPQPVWDDFALWYGEPKHPVPRTVVLRGEQKEPTVELYPLRVSVLRMVRVRSSSEAEPLCITMSASATVATLYSTLSKKVFPGNMGPFRYWRVNAPPSNGFTCQEFLVDDVSTYECEEIKGSGKTLEAVGFSRDDVFVVEAKDDGTGWLFRTADDPAPLPLLAPAAPIVSTTAPLFPSDQGFFAKMNASTNPSQPHPSPPRNASPFSFSRGSTALSSINKTIEPGTLGLGNMGNTCFMNSALQCLAHEPELADYFLNGVFQQELNPDNPLGMQGAIAEAFGALLQRIWASTAPSTSYSPREFKTQLQRFAPQFSGYQQHDSQELVAFLLDGLHEDLNRVIKKPYVEKPDWEGGGDLELVQLAQKSWDGYMLRNDSVIVDLFQGQYQSTLVCPECQKVSITFDPFMYLTLPLPIQKKWKHEVLYVPWDVTKPHLKVPVEIGRDASFRDLRQLLGRWMDVPPDNLLTLEVFSSKFFKSLDDGLLCGEMSGTDLIVCYELPCHAQQSRTYKKQPDDPLILSVYLGELKPPAARLTYSSNNTVTHFGHPMIAVIDRKDVTDADAIYGAIVARLERWVNNPRDLFTWEVAGPVGEVQPIQINGVPPVDSLVEIKANGDVVEHPVEAPEGDITDEKSFIVVEDEDLNMEPVLIPEPDLIQVGPKRDIFQIKITPNTTDYGTVGGNVSYIHHSRFDTFEARAKDATAMDEDDAPVLLRDGDQLTCEFDENMKAFYFGGYQKAKYELWEKFVHPEYEESQRDAEAKKNRGISLQDCMDEFTKEEQLGEDDLWYCPQCKKHQQATKKFDLWKAPDVLVVHLKRFSNSRTLRDKIDAFVDFPVDGLDLGDMVGERSVAKRLMENGVSLDGLQLPNLEEPLIYDLFGVDEHMGGLGGGHYRAYALNHTNKTWYHFDDSFVTPARPQDAVNANAYLLFYRRRTAEPLGGKTQAKIEAARLRCQTNASEPGIIDTTNDASDELGMQLHNFLPRSTSSTSMSSPSSMQDEPPDLEEDLDMLDPLARASQRFDFPDPSSNKASPASSTGAEGDPEMYSWPQPFNSSSFPQSSPTWSPMRSGGTLELHSSSPSEGSDSLNPFHDDASLHLNID
ncbi:hypothetical protein FB45DRAFT_921756 [Roridomyces roridus]|uniref:ubiquitinyl hydrolase 1 n=1 Tax=Roridomyces roridus TaxID=1738132 RepID=A0AAD7FI06_9AGAR|nr:hypothetical protein FB45DRAFT_921756 [Roridomyces roridus]